MIIAGTFKLTNGTMAISENNRKKVILIPPNARVAVLGEDTENDSFIKIRYQDNVSTRSPGGLPLRNRPTVRNPQIVSPSPHHPRTRWLIHSKTIQVGDRPNNASPAASRVRATIKH
jgi:hypothetical protein